MLRTAGKFCETVCLILVACAIDSCAQKASYDVSHPVEVPYYRVRYEASDKPDELIYGVNYTAWIPPVVKTLRGVILHQPGCGERSCKSGLTGVYDLHRPAFAGMRPANEPYSGAPAQSLVPIRFTDTKAAPTRKPTYRAIAVNTVGLKSKSSAALSSACTAWGADSLAGKRVVFLGDSITQSGGYVAFTMYYLEKLYPKKDFDIIGLGLSSETLSGLSEDGHAGGKFPRPCLFERLGRLLEKARPEVVVACYGMNDGIYLPLDKDRFAAFQHGVSKLIEQCKKAGAKQFYLVTPPIYDLSPKKGEFNYDTVLTEYAKWETGLQVTGVTAIDLHTAMRKARDARTAPFSRDKVHPGDDGHLLMAKTILTALGVMVPDEVPATIKSSPLFKLVEEKRAMRSAAWMKHIGYTREKTVKPQPLGTAEEDVAKLQEKIDALRRQP